MDYKLKEKKVFITGSSKGIGLSIALKFMNEGANVIINSRNSDDLIELTVENWEKHYNKLYGGFEDQMLDLESQYLKVKKTMKSGKKRFPRIFLVRLILLKLLSLY